MAQRKIRSKPKPKTRKIFLIPIKVSRIKTIFSQIKWKWEKIKQFYLLDESEDEPANKEKMEYPEKLILLGLLGIMIFPNSILVLIPLGLILIAAIDKIFEWLLLNIFADQVRNLVRKIKNKKS